MLELFLVMFAAAVQSAGTEGAGAAAPMPQTAMTAPAQQPAQETTQETAEAAPSFLAPSGTTGKADNAEAAAEAAPVFLAPGMGAGTGTGTGTGAGDGAASEAPPVFLAPQTAAQAEAPPVFLAPSASAAAPAPALVAEPQVPTGKFTTATEVRPIMSATKGNWIAVRQYEGQDYLYVTQIWSWRCGLAQMRYAVNGGPLQVWPLPPCHEEYATPNAILEADGNPMQTFPAGSIGTVEIEITYDDLSTDSAQFSRASVLMP